MYNDYYENNLINWFEYQEQMDEQRGYADLDKPLRQLIYDEYFMELAYSTRNIYRIY